MIALGLLEINSIARGVIAGDAMLKAAEVTLLKAGAVCPGKYTVVIYGEVAAVASAMDAGKRHAAEYLVDELTIASLDPQMVQAISGGNPPSDLSAMGVMEFYTIAAAVVAGDLHHPGELFQAQPRQARVQNGALPPPSGDGRLDGQEVEGKRTVLPVYRRFAAVRHRFLYRRGRTLQSLTGQVCDAEVKTRGRE